MYERKSFLIDILSSAKVDGFTSYLGFLRVNIYFGVFALMRILGVIIILALEIENGSPKKLEKVVRKRKNILAKNHFQSSSFLSTCENLGLLKIKFKSRA